MNREELKALGLSDEQIDKVMASHGKTVNSIKQKADRVDGLESQITDLEGQIKDRDKQLKDLSEKAGDNKELQQTIKDLQEANDTAKEEMNKKLAAQRKEFKLELALKDAKARNPLAVKALLDADKISLDGENLIGLDEQLKTLQESDAYLFESEEQSGGKPTFTTGQHGSGGSQVTKEDFSKMSYLERIKFKKENPTTYDELVGNN